MKKLINQAEHVVDEMLEGLLTIYPSLARLSHHKVILRADTEQVRDRQVAVISGGGSGHEPAHAGFVGAGMLSAAVAGEVFTSPPVEAVLAAIRAVAGTQGVVLIVKNYTGDRLNFGLAAEMARAEGIRVETVMVADDIALAATHEPSSRRGIAGTVLVHKIAGAAAAEGMSLEEVVSSTRSAAQDIASMGISLSAGTTPATGKPSYTLGEREVELGLGIHGEPGIRRSLLRTADEHADEIVDAIVEAHSLRPGDRIAVLVNNLGATTWMELAIVARRVVSALASRGLAVERVYAGTFMSSLDAAGVSVSVMRVNEQRLRLLDAPTSAPAWPRVSMEHRRSITERTTNSRAVDTAPEPERANAATSDRLHRAVDAACEAILKARDHLTELDRVVGDGDLGINLARGAAAVQEMLRTDPGSKAADCLSRLAEKLRSVVGGSSGAFYGVLILRAAKALQSAAANDPKVWVRACNEACRAVSETGGAVAGDRTMLDALLPFTEALSHGIESGQPLSQVLSDAATAAEQCAEATAQMLPRRGRSSYLGERCLGYPDPGAIAAAIWLRAVSNHLTGE
ncbi:MAG TPA: dihydroxyacetone kinase subunit DhaL [Bryobacteraceae bacterium]|nr:dihydroxyacetone kinase subunit DhaL [Bryobacteraceae bacterium]